MGTGERKKEEGKKRVHREKNRKRVKKKKERSPQKKFTAKEQG